MGIRLSGKRLQAALATAAEWQEAPDLESLPAIVLPGIQELFEVDASGWNDFDRAKGTLRLITVPEEATFMEDLPLLEALIEEHPMVPVLVNDRTPPTAWSDVIARRELERRQIYADFFEPHEIGGQMSFVFSTKPWIAITVNRRRDDFNADDRRLAAMLRPHLRAAYRNVGARQRAAGRASALERGIERLAGAVIVLGPERRIEHASALARDILGRWFASAGRARLPQALGEIAEGATFRRPGAVLRATRIGTDPPLMILDEKRLAVDPDRVAALGLTAREGAVLELVAHGLSNAQIAGELYISPRTVHKHLQNSYAKLGVADRARASALVLQDTV